jgi:hypothetical protein
VIERGTHQELMAAQGLYHEMVVRQMMAHGDEAEYTLSFTTPEVPRLMTENG